jgi:hypothetical protein
MKQCRRLRQRRRQRRRKGGADYGYETGAKRAQLADECVNRQAEQMYKEEKNFFILAGVKSRGSGVEFCLWRSGESNCRNAAIVQSVVKNGGYLCAKKKVS